YVIGLLGYTLAWGDAVDEDGLEATSVIGASGLTSVEEGESVESSST
nr:hypothetical protein [Tanacetum cinerariifolium]